MANGKQLSPGHSLTSSTGKLEDSYIVGVLIGRGSYSMVHKCLYKGKTERACKVYKKAHLEPNLVPAHIETILKLSHSNLISVHDVFETEFELQIVTDLVTGEELLERIERSEHYSEREASTVVHTILSTLQYLHSQRLPHGALLPENLIYEAEGPKAKLKLSEISVPKLSQSPTALPIYSGPSINSELPATVTRCAGDMWSLGILIYIMLCGSEPTSLDELRSHISGQSEGDMNDISASARDLITRLLQEEPSSRMPAEEALEHPWVCGSTVATRHMLDAQERLRTFNARRKLKATTHAIIAAQRAMSIVKPLKNCQVAR